MVDNDSKTLRTETDKYESREMAKTNYYLTTENGKK